MKRPWALSAYGLTNSSNSPLVQAFHDCGNPLPAANAHRGNPIALAASPQLVKNRQCQPGSGRESWSAGEVPAADSADVTVSDNSGQPVTLTALPDVISAQTSPDRFTITRAWMATDVNGNASTASFQIVVNDTTAPTLVLNSNLTYTATESWALETPIAYDNCGNATLQLLSSLTNKAGNDLTITRSWQATDASGNSTTAQESIAILGAAIVQPPVIISPPPCLNVLLGTDVTLNVRALGIGLSYQWLFNGYPVPGATDSALHMTSLVPSASILTSLSASRPKWRKAKRALFS